MLRLQELTIPTFPSSRAVGGNLSELIRSCSQLGTEHSSVIPLHMILRDHLKAGLSTQSWPSKVQYRSDLNGVFGKESQEGNIVVKSFINI